MQKRRTTRDRDDYYYYFAFKTKRKSKNIFIKIGFCLSPVYMDGTLNTLSPFMWMLYLFVWWRWYSLICQWCTLFSASTTYCHNNVWCEYARTLRRWTYASECITNSSDLSSNRHNNFFLCNNMVCSLWTHIHGTAKLIIWFIRLWLFIVCSLPFSFLFLLWFSIGFVVALLRNIFV